MAPHNGILTPAQVAALRAYAKGTPAPLNR